MKGSINRGGVKDGSESLLRALSGAPKCPAVGDRTIIYDFDIIYGGGKLGIRLPFGVGGINPPFGLPFGEWVFQIILTVNLPIATTFKIGMGQNCGAAAIDSLGKGRFLVKNGSWDKVTISQDGGGQIADSENQQWHVTTAVFADYNGPDLFSFGTFDLSAVGTRTVTAKLPAQSEFCAYQFSPFLYSTLPANNSVANAESWSNSINNFVQLAGWSLLLVGLPPNLYPDNTKLGTLRLAFYRSGQTPLFTFATSPPFNVTFSNRSFFNPSLNPVWDWDFGDGSAHSSLQNPVHAYPSTGSYIVKLKSTDLVETKIFDQVVILPLKADFTYTSRASFDNGPIRIVTPTDQSLGAVTWDWDWGDGSPHTTTQVIPLTQHEYPRNQVFTITLTVGDGTGKTSTISKAVAT